MITIILKWLKSWKIIKFWNFFFVLLWLFLSLTQPGSFHPSRPSGHCPCHWGHCLQSWIWWRTGPPPQLWGCMSLTWFSLRVWWGESSREEGGVAKGFEFPESSWNPWYLWISLPAWWMGPLEAGRGEWMQDPLGGVGFLPSWQWSLDVFSSSFLSSFSCSSNHTISMTTASWSENRFHRVWRRAGAKIARGLGHLSAIVLLWTFNRLSRISVP